MCVCLKLIPAILFHRLEALIKKKKFGKESVFEKRRRRITNVAVFFFGQCVCVSNTGIPAILFHRLEIPIRKEILKMKFVFEKRSEQNLSVANLR